MAKNKSKKTSSKTPSTGGRGLTSTAKGRGKIGLRSTSGPRATVHLVGSSRDLQAVAAAVNDTIDVGDTVVALVALLSVQPLPPVVIQPGTQGTVTHKDPVGNTTGYIVAFSVNAATRSAPAFSGQIREV